MAVTGRGRYLKSAHQVLGHWNWIGRRGEVQSYASLPRLIVAAEQEGWQFDHRVGDVTIFCGEPGRPS